MIKQLFEKITPYYDFMNDVMSLGMHRIWKKKFVNFLPSHSHFILDLATGSGDIAALMIQKNKNVYLSDINRSMIEVAQKKLINQGLTKNYRCGVHDATQLPFLDHTFDSVTISFGLRNIIQKSKAIDEIYRILCPGGTFLCMEFFPNTQLFGYNFYLSKIVPLLGKFFANDYDSYLYLANSIQNFWTQREFEQKMNKFQNIRRLDLLQSVISIYTAQKQHSIN